MKYLKACEPQTPEHVDFCEHMMLQMRMIEIYRVQQWVNYSRILTPDEAAEEWIPMFAAGFAQHSVRD